MTHFFRPAPAGMALCSGSNGKFSFPIERLGGDVAKSDKPMLILVTMVPDDSSSIAMYGNDPAIRRGHNGQIDQYQDSTNMLVKTRYLNGTVLFDYSPPSAAVRMNDENYQPKHGTPLYDEAFKILTEVELSAQAFSDKFNVFTMSCIMTDGHDTSSRHKSAADVRRVVERMFASARHIVAGLGVRDGHTDFTRIFMEMGIPEQWIMVSEREEGDIVRGMQHFAHTTRTVERPEHFTHVTVTGFEVNSDGIDPNKTGGYGATDIPSAETVGDMMGAATHRSPEELGQVPFHALSWQPQPFAYEWAPGDTQWKQAAAPFTTNAASGFYELPLPPENTIYLIGRGYADPNHHGDTRIDEYLNDVRQKQPQTRFVFLLLRDLRMTRRHRLSRFHAAIENRDGVPIIRPIGADIAVLTSDDAAADEYRQTSDGPAFIESGQRLRLTPNIIIRVV